MCLNERTPCSNRKKNLLSNPASRKITLNTAPQVLDVWIEGRGRGKVGMGIIVHLQIAVVCKVELPFTLSASWRMFV